MFVDTLIFFAVLFITFIPTIIAFYRNLKRRWACLIVNILLGWSLIFWVPIWIWSMLTSAVEEPKLPTGV